MLKRRFLKFHSAINSNSAKKNYFVYERFYSDSVIFFRFCENDTQSRRKNYTMAKFLYNNGKFKELSIPKKYDKTKIFLTVTVVPDDDIIQIAGHSIITCLLVEVQDVIFSDHGISQSNKLYGQQLEVNVDASKIKVAESDKIGSKVPITCKLIIEAGDDLLEEYELDDKKNPTSNSMFIFRIKFLEGAEDENNN
jgi:hypothetical protein